MCVSLNIRLVQILSYGCGRVKRGQKQTFWKSRLETGTVYYLEHSVNRHMLQDGLESLYQAVDAKFLLRLIAKS